MPFTAALDLLALWLILLLMACLHARWLPSGRPGRESKRSP